jgi:hypothetical protein
MPGLTGRNGCVKNQCIISQLLKMELSSARKNAGVCSIHQRPVWHARVHKEYEFKQLYANYHFGVVQIL